MNSRRLKLGVAGLVGFLAPLWWTWVVNQAAYAIHVAIGNPDRPTKAMLWGSVYAPSFLLGLIAGVVAAVLSPGSPMKGWVAFFAGLVVSGALIGAYLGEPIAYLEALFVSTGNALFFVGSLLWPVIAHVRKRAV
jgi:uncharacterized membrane protein YeaQ/YmgE (transglycosylase-associated protein family)